MLPAPWFTKPSTAAAHFLGYSPGTQRLAGLSLVCLPCVHNTLSHPPSPLCLATFHSTIFLQIIPKKSHSFTRPFQHIWNFVRHTKVLGTFTIKTSAPYCKLLVKFFIFPDSINWGQGPGLYFSLPTTAIIMPVYLILFLKKREFRVPFR